MDWLLSPAGQQVASSHAALGSIMEDTPGRWTSEAVLARSQGIVQPVVLSPALLVGLDQRRHSRFVQNWVRPGDGYAEAALSKGAIPAARPFAPRDYLSRYLSP